jgi:Putative FMN-binding domain
LKPTNPPRHHSAGFYFRKAQEINMYIPEPFREGRVEILHEAIRRAGLATLVSLTNDGLIASHIPLLLERSIVHLLQSRP